MAKKLKDIFTFGFELEGVFNSDTLGHLTGEFKDDGSVSVRSDEYSFDAMNSGGDNNCYDCSGHGYWDSDDCYCEPECNILTAEHYHDETCYPCNNGDSDYHRQTCDTCDGTGQGSGDINYEYASEVFYSELDMLDELSLFTNGENYVSNMSCGFHLHIAGKDDRFNEKLRAVMCNYDFVLGIYKMAITQMCECQKKRLQEVQDRWCRNWQDSNEAIRQINHSGKYYFMNFHNQGTLEFRFLSPCEHKVDNAKLLIRTLYKYLNKSNEYVLEQVEPNAKDSNINVLEQVQTNYKVISDARIPRNYDLVRRIWQSTVERLNY